MLRLSIIVPYAGRPDRFEATLVSVLQRRPEGCEVLVAHASCYDDPYDLGDEVRFVEARSGAGLVELINAGVEAARGEVVHWLQSGVEAGDGWTGPALGRFEDPGIAAVSPLVVSVEDPSRMVAAGVAYAGGGRRRVLGLGEALDDSDPSCLPVLGPTLLAAFYRRSALALLGGLDATLQADLSDVDMALSLKTIGYDSVLEPASRVYSASARRSSSGGGFGACRSAERLFWRHAAGQGWLRSLAQHPLAVGAGFVADLPGPSSWTGLLGRGAAWLEIVGRRRRYRQFQAAIRRRAAARGVSRGERVRSSITARAAGGEQRAA